MQVNTCTHITGEISLLGKYLVVDIQLAVECSHMGIKYGFISCQTQEVWFHSHFVKCLAGRVGEVERFDPTGLLEESKCLRVDRDELGSLVSVFRDNVLRNGTAFVKDEAIVILKKMHLEQIRAAIKYMNSGHTMYGT